MMASDLRRETRRGALVLFVASGMVLALGSVGFEPSMALFGVFAAIAVLLLGGWYVLDESPYPPEAWLVSATVAAVMVLSGGGASSTLQSVGVALAASGVVTIVISPAMAYAARAGESVGDRLTDEE
jgi:drug/metabolite transporter (DMT)-like permease